MRSKSTLAVRLLPGLDAVILAVSAIYFLPARLRVEEPSSLVSLLLIPAMLGLLRYFGLYESYRLEGFAGLARTLSAAAVCGWTVAMVGFWVAGGRSHGVELLKFTVLSFALLAAPRMVFYSLVGYLRRRGLDVRNVCVIGSADDAREMMKLFAAKPRWGLHVTCVGMGPVEQRQYWDYETREPLGSNLASVLSTRAIDEVLFVVRPDQIAEESATLGVCGQHGVFSRILMRGAQPEALKLKVEEFWGEASVTISDNRNPEFLVAKRLIDLAGSAFLLVALAPLMALIAILVKLSSPGPIIFRQTRIGRGGRSFPMLKFRTMVDGAEQMLPAFAHRNIMQGPVFKDSRDFRVTPLGRILRRFSLDELPQLFNVVLGQMSLVGPRPLPVFEAQKVVGAHRRRFCMKPGLTCLWQVRGRNTIAFAQWMMLDLEYIDNWSILLDAKLLLQTIPAVLSGRGAY